MFLFGGFGGGGSRRNLLGGGQKSKEAKRARAAKRAATGTGQLDNPLECSDELLGWERAGVLRRECDARNTQELKSMCLDNGIPRSGAKYEIIQAIEAHVKGFLRQQRLNALSSATTKGGSANASPGAALAAETELGFAKFKSLEAGAMPHLGYRHRLPEGGRALLHSQIAAVRARDMCTTAAFTNRSSARTRYVYEPGLCYMRVLARLRVDYVRVLCVQHSTMQRKWPLRCMPKSRRTNGSP
jgi:hypothetical protein